jgi:hypothetical protein
MKIAFVDGPLDGVSKQVESEPEERYYAPAIMYSNLMQEMENLTAERAFMFDHKHLYRKGIKNPATGTLIYFYMGVD